MIKRAIKSVSVIIFWLVTIYIVFTATKWWGYRNWTPPQQQTIFIPDTLDYSIPDYVEKPSLFFGILHTTIPPKTMRPIRYEEWMDSVFSAYATVIKNGTLNIKGKRGKISHEFTYDDIPENVEIYGTETGFKIIRNRFSNPIRWTGVLLSCDYGYMLDSETPKRVISWEGETGIIIKRVSFLIYGGNKEIGIRGRVRFF